MRLRGCKGARQGPKALLAVIALVLAGSGAACSSNQENGGSGVVPWFLNSILGDRQIRIGAHTESCAGGPKPTLSAHVRYAGKKAYITARLHVPQWQEEGLSNGCRGTGWRALHVVRLSRDVRSSVILDAGEDPPVVRWPDSD